MDISVKTDGGKTFMTVTGRVDTTTAPDLDAALGKITGATALVLDISGVTYMSSAGLRSLLASHKNMVAGGGSLTISGTQPAVREVFDITGFADFLTLI